MTQGPDIPLEGKNLPIPPAVAETFETPFVVELRQVPEENPAYFRPVAVLRITPTLRRSGLLRALAPELARTLLFILTFLSSQGECLPTLPEIAHAMGLSSPRARSLVGRLRGFRWHGEPILREVRRESGLHAYAPTSLILSVVQAPPDPGPASEPIASSREAVVAHSRERYARPREEVEAEIEALRAGRSAEAGWLGRSSDPVLQELRRRLIRLGVSGNQVEYLISEFLPDRIARQISWLRFRRPRNPAALVIRAIEKDYEEPAALHSDVAAPSDTDDAAPVSEHPVPPSDPAGKGGG